MTALGCEQKPPASHPNINWRGQIDHGVKIGLGTDQYELIRI